MDILSDPAKGSRTLLEALTAKAYIYPSETYAHIPNGSTVEEGFRAVTYEQILHAVDATAFWLEDQLGKSTDFETLLYVGVSDLRYVLIFFAAQKCGYKAMFISPTNALDHNAALLRDTTCQKSCFSPELRPLINSLTSLTPSHRSVEMPIWTHFLATYTIPYPFTSPFSTSEHHPVLVLHSSGSTGRPKPIVLPNGALANLDRHILPPAGRQMGGYANHDSVPSGTKTFSPTPPYHFSGFMSYCCHTLFRKTCPVLGPVVKGAMKPGMVKEILEREGVGLLSASPAVIEGVYHLPGGKEVLQGLRFVSYAGGPLAGAVGDGLKDSTFVVAAYGSTETGGPILLRPEREDWQYLEPHPDYADEFEPVMDGVFELVYRDKGKLKPPLVYTYTQPAGTREYRTKDLFVPHLTKSGLWRFYGRRDDVLVLSTGLKMNPLPVELAVTGHPGVSGSLVVGQGRDRTVLLIEPIERVGEIETFLEGLWPAVERANADLDEGARVERNMLLVVEPGAFVRAPKGTVVRQRTTDNFDGDIGKIIQAASRRDLGALANEQLVRNRSGPRFREPMCLKK